MRMAKVVGTITPGAPYGIDPPESPAERAAHAALMSVADFYIELGQVSTVDEALRLHKIIEEVSESFSFIARAALLKADGLCGREQ